MKNFVKNILVVVKDIHYKIWNKQQLNFLFKNFKKSMKLN